MSAPNNHYSFCDPAFLMANLGLRFNECNMQNSTGVTEFILCFKATLETTKQLQDLFQKPGATAFCEDFGCAKIWEIQLWFSMVINALPTPYPALDNSIQKLANNLTTLSTNIDCEVTCNGQSKKEAVDGVADDFIQALKKKEIKGKTEDGEWNVYVPLCLPCPIHYNPLHPEKYKFDRDKGKNICRKILEKAETDSLRRSVYITKYLKDLKVYDIWIKNVEKEEGRVYRESSHE